jgi:hypothetical protein
MLLDVSSVLNDWFNMYWPNGRATTRYTELYTDEEENDLLFSWNDGHFNLK